MAFNITTNIYSSIVNNNSRLIDEQQVILENYIKQTRVKLERISLIELNDIDSYYDELKTKKDEVRDLKAIINNVKKQINEINEAKNEINTLSDEKLNILNKNKFEYGLQGIVKTKLKTMPDGNFTEEQKKLINSPYKRIV